MSIISCPNWISNERGKNPLQIEIHFILQISLEWCVFLFISFFRPRNSLQFSPMSNGWTAFVFFFSIPNICERQSPSTMCDGFFLATLLAYRCNALKLTEIGFRKQQQKPSHRSESVKMPYHFAFVIVTNYKVNVTSFSYIVNYRSSRDELISSQRISSVEV